MRFKIVTPILKDYKEVFAQFDEQLFRFLTPDEKQMKLVKFGGSTVNDEIHIQFLKPMKGEWISVITEVEENDKECFFVDEGKKLPFGLKKWKHRHIVKKEGNGCVIVDDIYFSFGFWLIDFFAFPGLYLAFAPRKKLYKKYFV